MAKRIDRDLLERKIFEILEDKRLSIGEVQNALIKMGLKRTFSSTHHNLRDMFYENKLEREKNSNGNYVYWNPDYKNEEIIGP
jgi:hypothetical protein